MSGSPSPVVATIVVIFAIIDGALQVLLVHRTDRKSTRLNSSHT